MRPSSHGFNHDSFIHLLTAQEDQLFESWTALYLAHRSDVILAVNELSTGQSHDIHGQVFVRLCFIISACRLFAPDRALRCFTRHMYEMEQLFYLSLRYS